MKLISIWRFKFWIRLTHDDAWGIQVGLEYRRRPVHEPGAVGFKEWVVGFHFNKADEPK